MNSAQVVLDASAVLCLMLSEPGAERVEAALANAVMAAVNYGEVFAKLADRGASPNDLMSDIGDLGNEIMAVDRELAEIGARMRSSTRQAGLSLGDRTCLALAIRLRSRAVTADRAWSLVAQPLGIEIECIR